MTNSSKPKRFYCLNNVIMLNRIVRMIYSLTTLNFLSDYFRFSVFVYLNVIFLQVLYDFGT